MKLDSLFKPIGIAIVGASESRHYPRSIIRNMLNMGYPAERIFPVNPKYDFVFGLKCYSSLSAIPFPISFAVLATHKDVVPELIVEAGRCGVKFVHVLGDGYAEQGREGKQLQNHLVDLVKQYKMSLLGPNTLGFIFPETGAGSWGGGIIPGKIENGNIALLFQSSGMLNLMLSLSAYRHLGLRAAVSVGNEADLELADFVDYFVEDAKTDVIVVLLETSVRPARLVESLWKARLHHKPVIMLKLGYSERAQRNAIAHTGRLASSGKSWEALLKKLGVVLVEDMDELIETADLFAHRSIQSTLSGLGVCTISGGDCSLLSDLADRYGLSLPDIHPDTRSILVEKLEKSNLLGNPLDCENLYSTNPVAFQQCIRAFSQDPNLDVIAVRMNLSEQPNDRLKDIYDLVITEVKHAGKMPVILSRANEPLSEEWFQFFKSKQTPFLPSYRTALMALKNLLTWDNLFKTGDYPKPTSVPENAISKISHAKIARWDKVQKWLTEAHIPYVTSSFARTIEDAVIEAENIGFPVVVKLVSADIPHKSELGAVRLNLCSQAEVRSACQAMLSRFHELFPDKAVDGFEVQAMLLDGAEFIVGMSLDPVVGPVMLVGTGGIYAEALRDTVLAIPPISDTEARELLMKLKSYPMLLGSRGKSPLDIDAFVHLLVCFSEAITKDSYTIREIDLNPVLVLPQGRGAVAVDALMTIQNDEEGE